MTGLLLALLIVCAAGCSQDSRAKELNLTRSSLSSQSSSKDTLPPSDELGEKEYEELSGQTADVTDPDPDYEPIDFEEIFSEKDETAVVALTNKIRIENGLSPLKVYSKLTDAARYRALEMYKNKYFSHKRPDGSPWYTLYLWEIPMEITRIGENLARVSRGADKQRQRPEDWVEMWVNSPEHYKTMMNPDYTYIGVGIYQTEVNGVYYAYAAQEFATYAADQLQEEPGESEDQSDVSQTSSGEEQLPTDEQSSEAGADISDPEPDIPGVRDDDNNDDNDMDSAVSSDGTESAASADLPVSDELSCDSCNAPESGRNKTIGFCKKSVDNRHSECYNRFRQLNSETFCLT